MKKKEWVKKVILILVCIAIILFIIIKNIIGKQGKETSAPDASMHQTTDGVATGEALKYFSALFFNGEERQALDWISEYKLMDQASKYETYLNAAISAKIFQNAKTDDEPIDLDHPLTCGQFRDLLWAVVDLCELDYSRISKELPERFSTVTLEDEILLSEFLDVYETLVTIINEQYINQNKEVKVEVQKLYFLSEIPKASDTIYLRAQNGKDYDLSKMQDYRNMFTDTKSETLKLESYVGAYISAMAAQGEVLYLREELDEPVTLYNVYLQSGKERTIQAFLCDLSMEFKTNASLSDEFQGKIGDLTIDDGVITGVTIKPDIIHGKVLLTGRNAIEIEGYGLLPLHEEYQIYKLYGEMETEKTNSILVGYSVTDFVVSEGKICAALIQEPIKAQNIRVVVNSTNYESLYHKSITLTSDTDYTIDNGDSIATMKAGEPLTISRGAKLMEKGRIKIKSTEENGKIMLSSLKRNYGVPKYRGTIEIAVTDQGLVVVNELSIEEYLYAVVPSEMPTSYGDEALKVQAVCARSYAFKQLMANRFSEYGAHVDDSVNCQVYNNVEENEASILAVKETYGQVLTSDSNVITAYYFSTSCGHTADIQDVWEDASAEQYLTGVFQTDATVQVDFSSEDSFRTFLENDCVSVMQNGVTENELMQTYDSGYLMYRWNVTMDLETLSGQINASLNQRYRLGPSSLLTYVSDMTVAEAMEQPYAKTVDGKLFISRPISTIGTVKKITVTDRAKSGIIREMIIEGTKNTILVRYQTNIRTLFAPVSTPITRLDGSTINGMSLLPSAFCIIDPVTENGTLTGFKITGGGFGHGVGMSQNGVKAMTNEGKTYQQILSHYYQGSEIELIYKE